MNGFTIYLIALAAVVWVGYQLATGYVDAHSAVIAMEVVS